MSNNFDQKFRHRSYLFKEFVGYEAVQRAGGDRHPNMSRYFFHFDPKTTEPAINDVTGWSFDLSKFDQNLIIF